MSTVGIWSEKNNLKHYLAGTQSATRPNVSDGAGGFFSTSTVVHNLGYKPLVRGYFDPNNNGTIFPLMGQYVFGNTADSLSPLIFVSPFMFFVSNVTTTTVTFSAWDNASSSATFNFYYRIYIDPTL